MKVSECEGCKGCPMAALFPNSNFVPAKLASSNRIGIGEAPGEQESIQLEPFVGTSGSLLEVLYSKAGLSKKDISFVNVLSCRPPDNIFPDSAEASSYISKKDAQIAITQCVHNHVKPVLESRKWERVDLIGEKALRYIAKLNGGIYSWRGSIIDIDTETL